MAKLGAEIGLPTVEPGRAPGVYQTAQATADTFGASQARERARAAQGIAQDMQQLSGTVIKAIDYYDETAADDAANQFQARVGTLLNGDPNVQGPDGQPDLGYLATRGRMALDERERVEKRITEYEKELQAGLKNERQRKKFSDFATKYRTTVTGKISNHADTQNVAWSESVNVATEKLALDQIAQDPTNAVSLATAAADLRSARVKTAQLKGGGPELVAQAIASADRDFIKTQTQAIAVTDPVRALEILDKNRNAVGVDYDNLANAFRVRASEQKGLAAAEVAIARVSGQPLPPAPVDTPQGRSPILTAILNQESNDNPNAPTSVNGAVGPGQILPGTFQQFAQPGERIDNPDDNRRVAQRIVETYERKYNGDPARVAVAYFSGEGNVAPEGSPTPWKRDVVDGNGKSVSSYVDDVNARLGGGVRARIAEGKAVAVASIMADKSLDPKARSTALTRINQQFEIMNLAALSDEKAKKDAEEKAADGYVQAILKGETVGLLAQITNDRALSSSKREHLANMLNQHIKGDLGGDLKTYGPGFYDIWRRVHAPQGDPNRITDPTQLFAMVGPQTGVDGQTVPGKLTVAGVAKLAEEIKGKRTPEGEAASAMKTQFFANAKAQISGSNDFFKMRDPKGEELFLKFQAQVYPLIEQGFRDGKTAAQLFNPDSPDYVGRVIAGFKRTPAQIMADLESAGTNVPNAAAGKVDTSTPDGLRAAVASGAITREEGIRIGLERGWIRAAAPKPTGPQVPISQ